jgi:hypothetical protein
MLTFHIFAAFDEGWGKVVDGEQPSNASAADPDTDFAHSKNYTNADAHIKSYGTYPTLFSDDKETQLEAVVEDAQRQADIQAAESDTAAAAGGQTSQHTAEQDGNNDTIGTSGGGVIEQAEEAAAKAQAAGSEAVHQLAVAGNAAAEHLEEAVGLDSADGTSKSS